MVLGAGHYWIQIDDDGELTGRICSGWYGESDKPVEGKWILVKTVEATKPVEETVKEQLECQDCGDKGDYVEKTTCPYNEEVNRIIEEITVCKACYRERMYDI